jgi:cyclase
MMDRLRLLERREVDEIIILDISATPNNRSPRFDEVKSLCENLFMPVTVGGGVKNVNDIRRLLESGADKVAINTMALQRPELIDEASRKFGAQAIVISIDSLSGMCRSHGSRNGTVLGAVEAAREFEARGAGEILLTDVERDGTMEGYNLDLIRSVSESVSIPVIACGGCSSYEDMERAFKAGAHAVAVGALFQFTDNTPRGASRYLNEHGIPAR